jgi:hypothetical protein
VSAIACQGTGNLRWIWPAAPMMAGRSGASRRADMFIDDDPRENGPRLGDERTTLVEYLRCQRLTLELKCSGLDAAALTRRALQRSTMSLLGLVRHLADVESGWFRRVMAGFWDGQLISLREVLVHMVEEYAGTTATPTH